MGFASSLELSVVLSTFERPYHLRRSLESLLHQDDAEGRFEVVVADDGSCDETRSMMATFAKDAPFPVKFTTHDHRDFRLARSRNEGAAIAEAPYLLFSDGDCVFPRQHLACHLAARRPRRVLAGGCYRCDEAASAALTLDVIRSGEFRLFASARERRRFAAKARRATVSQLLRLSMRPRLTGSNISVWRDDFERVNGFDRKFVGWGLEDRDFQRRLELAGVRAKTILGQTVAYHLWHPPHPTQVRNSTGTPNLRYYERGVPGTRCADGYDQTVDEGVQQLDLQS